MKGLVGTHHGPSSKLFMGRTRGRPWIIYRYTYPSVIATRGARTFFRKNFVIANNRSFVRMVGGDGVNIVRCVHFLRSASAPIGVYQRPVSRIV